MRILFVTNHFPPSVRGWGYMQLCEEVADGLFQRGNKVAVLTSESGKDETCTDRFPVYRNLRIEPDWDSATPAALQFFWGRRRREIEALADLKEIVDLFHPDLFFVWQTIGLPRVILAELEAQKRLPVVNYLADYLPEVEDEYSAYWTADSKIPGWSTLKRILRPIALQMLQREGKPIIPAYTNTICVSRFLRDRLVSRNLIPSDSVVINNGIDTSRFVELNKQRNRLDQPPRSFLVAGRLSPEKGIHTVIEGFGMLLKTRPGLNVRLTLLGDGRQGYLSSIRSRIRELELEENAFLRLPVARGNMPDVLREHDVLILPSEWPEPLARVMQEAMGMGLLVLGTDTGGSGELLHDGTTGVVFEAGNAESLMRKLCQIVDHPGRYRTMVENGQATVAERFDIRLTIERIEAYLCRLLGGGLASCS